MKLHSLLLILAVGVISACRVDSTKTKMIGRVPGYKPIYSNDIDLYVIQNKPARAVVKAGKIYVKDNYIFQNEIGEGMHIINNSNPANAQRIGFISIKGSQEIAIKGNFLYSNNLSDLVVIDISNIANVKEVNRIKNTFYNANFQLAPPLGGGYFECVDKSKGVVTGWQRDSIDNPTCSN
jgi:hypothetical protein